MPRPKKGPLPTAELRAALDRKLVANAFTGYAELSEWLVGKGYAIGKTALNDNGSALTRRIEQLRYAREAAEALCTGIPDDAGAMTDASLRLAQERIFKLMLAGEQGGLAGLCRAAHAVAALARTSLAVRHDRRQALARAEEALDARLAMAEKRAAVDSQAVLRRIREEMYGMTPE